MGGPRILVTEQMKGVEAKSSNSLRRGANRWSLHGAPNLTIYAT